MSLLFEDYKSKMFKILLGDDPFDTFLTMIDDLYAGGHSKIDIYRLFLELQLSMREDPRTSGNDTLDDQMVDFLDGFSAWGKSFKILPQEPDVETLI